MIRTSKCYVTADELAETYGISLGQAYKIIHNLNQELKEKGYHRNRSGSFDYGVRGNGLLYLKSR